MGGEEEEGGEGEEEGEEMHVDFLYGVWFRGGILNKIGFDKVGIVKS